MNSAENQLRGIIDPRLAVHASSNQPAWLWSIDGARILWANPVGALLFGAPTGAALAKQGFGPADSHRRQIAHLADRLLPDTAPRLERLRGFGAALGSLVTCTCSRLTLDDGTQAILLVAAAPSGRGFSVAERLQKLIDNFEVPVAAFTRDGVLISASATAHALSLSATDIAPEALRLDALKNAHAEKRTAFGHVALHRVGTGADIGLIAILTMDALSAAGAGADAESPGAKLLADTAAKTVDDQPSLEPSDIIADVFAGDDVAADAFTQATAEPQQAPAPIAREQAAADTSSKPIIAEEISRLEAAIDATGIRSHIVHCSFNRPERREEPIKVGSPYGEATSARDANTSIAPEPAEPSAAQLERRIPLRFMWQMDADGFFSLGSDEFTRLIGTRTAAGFGRLWTDIVQTFDLDPDNRVAKAVATREIWSGITLLWPADGGMRLAVELSAVPIYDRGARFAGYRGFGVCRDLYRMSRLASQRQHELFNEAPARVLTAADIEKATGVVTGAARGDASVHPEPIRRDNAVENPENVVQFRPGDPKSPVLTTVENNAFNELARQLSARLDLETGLTGEPSAQPEPDVELATAEDDSALRMMAPAPEAPIAAATIAFPHDTALLDLLPVGVLVARLETVLYANPAFLTRMGFATLQALDDAGGLDAVYLDPDTSFSEATLEGGSTVIISATHPTEGHAPEQTDARIFTITWDDEPALALIFARTHTAPATTPVEAIAVTTEEATVKEASVTEQLPVAGTADAEDLGAILDTMAEGIVMFDGDGQIHLCNRSAEALFGYDGEHLTQQNLVDLFVPESRRVVSECLDNIKGAAMATLLDNGREALAKVNGGGIIPLSVTIGRTRQDGLNFFAVFRDLTQTKKTETELQSARRTAERAAGAKADVVARISHEVRAPLNAIIGFAEVMTEERFGALGNERYVEYMKDISASGERVMTIINDLLDLSRIESGQLDLAFTNENLNEMVEQCVSVMQPQANRARIIIRSSLGHHLPYIAADTQALRQIVLNLIGNSIHLANAGGQVIVSTAVTDSGEVALRVRDTGQGMNDNELAAALEPFNSPTPSDHASENTGINLSLTRALIEANRARFRIRTAPTSGTLIEVVFAHANENA